MEEQSYHRACKHILCFLRGLWLFVSFNSKALIKEIVLILCSGFFFFFWRIFKPEQCKPSNELSLPFSPQSVTRSFFKCHFWHVYSWAAFSWSLSATWTCGLMTKPLQIVIINHTQTPVFVLVSSLQVMSAVTSIYGLMTVMEAMWIQWALALCSIPLNHHLGQILF